jgi:DNA-binding CsgD family transcriptional regulator
MQHTLPAGLLPEDSNIEFFVCGDLNAYKRRNGQTIKFEDFGEPVYRLIEQKLAEHPEKQESLTAMGLTERLPRIKQAIVCMFGGYDNSPDIKDGVLQHTEYWACPKRGTCSYEGKLCDSLRTDTGEHLTSREIDYLKLTAQGYLDKEIATKLGLALNTVTTHSKNTRHKTGLFRKADLTRFAIQKNLI